MDAQALFNDYISTRADADGFLDAFLKKLQTLIADSNWPVLWTESRVKEMESIRAAFQKDGDDKQMRCIDLEDLIGVRLIALFLRDVDKLCSLVETTFPVLARKEKQGEPSQFGYRSRHFTVNAPQPWVESEFSLRGQFRVEIQVRSIAEHAWAAASHKLQYKRDSDIPPTVKRSFARLSALLELVDIEFDEILEQREAHLRAATGREAVLDTDILRMCLDKNLPEGNRVDDEDYSSLLAELRLFGLTTVAHLESLVGSRLSAALNDDKEAVRWLYEEHKRLREKYKSYRMLKDERAERGVCYSHGGLVRVMLGHAFPQTFNAYRERRLLHADPKYRSKMDKEPDPPPH